MSELERFSDWKNKRVARADEWLAWKARADLAAEHERELIAVLKLARPLAVVPHPTHGPREVRRVAQLIDEALAKHNECTNGQ